MRLYVDEDVPDSVARFLEQRGHEVALVRERFIHEPKIEDYVIARAASEEAAVVVTWSSAHFRSLGTRRRDEGELRYPGMSLIAFECPHPTGLPASRRLSI